MSKKKKGEGTYLMNHTVKRGRLARKKGRKKLVGRTNKDPDLRGCYRIQGALGEEKS